MAKTGVANITHLPSKEVDPFFGKVSYRRMAGEIEVTFTVMPESVGEGWRAGIALDGSVSMQGVYGKMIMGNIPDEMLRRYRKKDWAREQVRDGEKFTVVSRRGWEDAFANGLVRWTENIAEPVGRDLMQHLANAVDARGRTAVAYFGCGLKGDEIEEFKEVRGEQCENFEVGGPLDTTFGRESQMLPALKFYDESFANDPGSLVVFVTDGGLKDLDAVKAYSKGIAKRIASGKRNPMKCVLIGIGEDLDDAPLQELDDLVTNTNVDLWDYLKADGLREASDLIREIVEENALATGEPTRALDSRGNEAQSWPDGMPARVTFTMPDTSNLFELELPEGQTVKQELFEAEEGSEMVEGDEGETDGEEVGESQETSGEEDQGTEEMDDSAEEGFSESDFE